jgi:hypothetical protein
MSAPSCPPDDPQHPSARRDQETLAAAALAYARARAEGRNTRDAATVATETVRGIQPAWPATMVSDAVSAAVATVEQAAITASEDTRVARDKAESLRPARVEDVTALLSYALRFGLDGKPRRAASDFLAPLAAAQIYQHMERAGLVILQKPAAKPHPGMG